MCMGCWQEMGSPSLDSPKIRLAADLIDQVYDHSTVGGNLHIVVDDWNLEDSHLKFCSDQINTGGWMPEKPDDLDFALKSTSEQPSVERQCCDLLMELSKDERASALAIYDKFIP